jgi:pimeloyl-ACP methyl ester carboxylesterase
MSYPEMAQDVLDLIEREQLEHPFVIGHSMGGKTAMALALLHPEAIDGVAVVDIAPMHYAGQFASHVAAMRGVDLAGAEHRRKIRQMLASRLEGDAPVDFLMQNLRRQNDCFDWRLNLMATAVCMPDLCGFPEALYGRRYEGPALFVSGGESDYVGNEAHARILRMFPHAQLQSIAEAGHWVHADQPDALLCALHEWLSDAVASAPR